MTGKGDGHRTWCVLSMGPRADWQEFLPTVSGRGSILIGQGSAIQKTMANTNHHCYVLREIKS